MTFVRARAFAVLVFGGLALLGNPARAGLSADDRALVQLLAETAVAEWGKRLEADALFGFLRPGFPEARVRAIQLLGEPQQAHAASLLRKWLQSGNPKVRAPSAAMLGSLGRFGSVAVPDLIRLLGDSDADVREAAVGSLRALGVLGKPQAIAGAVMRLVSDLTGC